MTLARLIEAVGNGTFLMDVLPPEHEATAYEAFSGSLDAAKRLHDALLPGWTVDDMGHRAGGWRVQLGRFDGKTPRPAPSAMIDGNPARAWLLAILRAMEGRDG